MSAFDPAAISRVLSDFFRNGKGEAGLEVGADPGLAASEYIRIPERMFKAWAVRIKKDDMDAYVKEVTDSGADAPWDLGAEPGRAPSRGGPAEALTRPGWVKPEKLTVHEGTLWVEGIEEDYEVDNYLLPQMSADDIRAFYTVNVGHIRDAEFDEATQMWVHATRFWTVAAGFCMTSKSTEWVRVEDPAQPLTGDAADAVVAFIASYSANAFTALAARGTSWRKANHATGGDVVSGFPRRWLSKMGYIRPNPDRAQAQRQLRNVTSAFYIATHAASVHAILALMVPEDTHHWVTLSPSAGLIVEWSIGESARVRMAPRTQVAGTAIVVDAVVVLKMAIKEGIAPLISAIDQTRALMAAHREVEENGMRCAVYGKWFFDGHPDNLAPVTFTQKDAAFSDLVGELAVIGTKYYAGSTIAGSASLANAAQQMSDEVAKQNWTTLGAQRRAVSGTQLIDVVAAIKGASAATAVQRILARDEATIRAGITEYNGVLQALAADVGLAEPILVDVDRVVAARTAAGASTVTTSGGEAT